MNNYSGTFVRRSLNPSPELDLLVVVLARCNSSRFPKKVLQPVAGMPLIVYLVERCGTVLPPSRSKIVVATSSDESDDQLASLLHDNEIECFRGSQHDVLARFSACARKFPAQHIVRVNGDCPLLDPRLIVEAHSFLQENPEFDYVSTILRETFPLGMHVEAMKFSTCMTADRLATGREQREHVTPVIYNNPELFALGSIENESDMSHYRLTVDYPEDLELVKKILEKTDSEFPQMEKIIDVLETWPRLQALNSRHKKRQALWQSVLS